MAQSIKRGRREKLSTVSMRGCLDCWYGTNSRSERASIPYRSCIGRRTFIDFSQRISSPPLLHPKRFSPLLSIGDKSSLECPCRKKCVVRGEGANKESLCIHRRFFSIFRKMEDLKRRGGGLFLALKKGLPKYDGPLPPPFFCNPWPTSMKRGIEEGSDR